GGVRAGGGGCPAAPARPGEEASQSAGRLRAAQPSSSRSALEGRRQGPDLCRRSPSLRIKAAQPRRQKQPPPSSPSPPKPSTEPRRRGQHPAGGMARPELPLLRKPRGLFPLLALLAFALLLEGRCGRAAPLPGTEGAPALAKIYPRGSHWAVGHFMGKKSTGDFPYMYEERNEAPFSSLSDNVKQLGDYLHWDEMFKQFLRLLEGNENRSAQVLREEVPFSAKSTWEAEDNSSLKDMMDFLLQALDRKESSPS
ncbi:hypothetical protein lerEdw1_005701, partial [Lerista edwardsae]